MPICRDCKKDVVKDYQTIQTQRKTNIHICNECMKKYQRKEVKGADNHK